MIGQDGTGPLWQLIARYLSERCSEQERRRMDVWRVGDPGNDRLLDRARLLWIAAGEPGHAEPTPEKVRADWERLTARRARREEAVPNPADPLSPTVRHIDEPTPPELSPEL